MAVRTVTVVASTAIPPYKKPKPQLSDLIEKYKGEGIAGKMVMMGTLREYVRRQDPYILRDEIRNISSEEELNILQGVGIRGFLWYEVQKQKARCIGL